MENLSEHPVYGVSVKNFGARGDGGGDDAPSIQKALDSGSPLVVVPGGCYRIGRTLRIHSGTRLHVHPRATLVQADGFGRDHTCFLLTNSDHERGNCDITIEGGIWDGNNRNNQRGPDQPGAYTGVLTCFFNVKRLTLRDLQLSNPVSYYTRFSRVSNFLVEHIRFRTMELRPNQDGIHLGGECQDGIIRHIDGRGTGTPGDDVVALNADDANQRAQNLGKVNGFIRRIHIHDLYAEDCHTFVRILSAPSPISQIEIENVHGGCQVCALNLDAARGCLVPVFDEQDPRYANGIGTISDIRIRDLRIHKSSAKADKPLLDILTRMRNFTVEDLIRDHRIDAHPAAPTMRMGMLPNTDLVLEGLTPDQIDPEQLIGSGRLTRMESTHPAPLYRMQRRLAFDETSRLMHGGFQRLHVSEGCG